MRGLRAPRVPAGAAPPWGKRAEVDGPTLTPPEVAARLRRSTGWFYRHRRRLQREHGFPPPAPGTLVWSARLVELWVEGDYQHTDPARAERTATADAALWAERLAARIPEIVATVKPGRRKAA